MNLQKRATYILSVLKILNQHGLQVSQATTDSISLSNIPGYVSKIRSLIDSVLRFSWLRLRLLMVLICIPPTAH